MHDARPDVVVIGAGAAGLMAAIVAARRGRRVVLLEKNRRPGLKILISGGGRCNLTTTKHGPELEREYGERRGRFLRPALRSFPPRALRDLVEGAGVALQEEDLDKIFPVSGKAADVLAALLQLANEAGVTLCTESPMLALTRATGSSDPGVSGFAVTTPKGTFHAPSVVLATGGISYPRTGATGDGYRACVAFGHRLVAPVPALAPLRASEPWIHALAGIVLTGCELSVLDRERRPLCTRRRPILFTHQGLSGPAPMDVSGFVEELGGATLRFDFVPSMSAGRLEQELVRLAQEHGRKQIAQGLPRELPERLREALARLAGAGKVTAAELKREVRQRLIALLKGLELDVASSLGFAHAEVTRGGIALEEVDPKTMASRIVPGLFLCGELLDVDGPIGGFNFQAAFATGRLAGLAV